MSDTHLQSDIADLRDELNALGEKLQRQIDDLLRYTATLQASVLHLQNTLTAPVPQSLRA